MASSSGFQTAGVFDNDWQYQDNIEPVTWERKNGSSVTGLKARFGDFDTPDLQAVAAGLAFTNEASGVVVWQPTVNGQAPAVPFAPACDDILRKETGDKSGWLVKGILKSRFGHWSIACDREVVNG